MNPTHGNWPKGNCSVYEAEGQHCSGWRMLEAEVEKLRAELEEDLGVIAVWRRRTYEAEDEVERLRAALHRIGNGDWCIQLTSLPPICSRAYEARRVLGESGQ